MLLALLGCSFFILAVIVIFLSDPFPLGQISVDLSVVSESSEILRNNSLVSVCLSVPKCWEYKNVGSSKMFGGQNCWVCKNVGSTNLFGEQKCWEVKIVGSSNMLGVIPNCNFPLFMKLKCWTKWLEDQNDGGSN